MLSRMVVAQEIERVGTGLLIWQVYDPAVKADLFSTSFDTSGGRYLVDPVKLETDALRKLQSGRKVSGIVVTNENHARAANEFADRFSVPIYLHEDAREGGGFRQTAKLEDGQEIEAGLTAVAIEGAPAGEIAVYYEPDGGTMIVGDALINFEPYGFGLLPAKYCRNFKLMCRSLPKLLDYTFERMFFAHGTPILSGARARLKQLLN